MAMMMMCFISRSTEHGCRNVIMVHPLTYYVPAIILCMAVGILMVLAAFSKFYVDFPSMYLVTSP